MIIPEMGRLSLNAPGGIAAALFTPVQQAVLGLLFGQPDRRFQSGQLIRLAGSGTGAAHRQLQRLEAAGLVVAVREGNQKYYQANRASPVFAELHGLIQKTVGMAGPLRNALAPHASQIRAAFVFGSVAAGVDTARSDIDVFIVGALAYADAFAALQAAEARLGRSVNPTLMTLSDWKRKRGRRDSFVARVADQPKLFLIGDDDALA
jgi:predicted nucleotidyltransferase